MVTKDQNKYPELMVRFKAAQQLAHGEQENIKAVNSWCMEESKMPIIKLDNIVD
jgi:hypothetical protein